MRQNLRDRISWNTFVPAFYWGATYALRAALTIVVRWRVRGRDSVPRSGGIIVVANHLNNVDPPVLGAAIAKRRIRYMAKVELFKFPIGVIPRLYGAFPVRRFDADARALLAAERMLREGQAVGMFPEGTRSRTGRMGPVHPGTAVVALRSGAVVIPCAITGTQAFPNPLRVLKRPRIEVAIGEPLQFEARRRPSEAEVADATAKILTAIKDLLPSSYQPTYTDLDGNGTQEAQSPD